MNTNELRTHLHSLSARRASAADIAAARNAYIGAAVTEIASFRAQLSARQIG
jgi:hypothetical protein